MAPFSPNLFLAAVTNALDMLSKSGRPIKSGPDLDSWNNLIRNQFINTIDAVLADSDFSELWTTVQMSWPEPVDQNEQMRQVTYAIQNSAGGGYYEYKYRFYAPVKFLPKQTGTWDLPVR